MRLDDIRKRLGSITQWPWKSAHIDNPAVDSKWIVVDGSRMGLALCQVYYRRGCETNAHFIAAAPEDISYLLARVEKLEGLLQDLLDAIPKQTNDCDWWQDDLTNAVAEARTLLAGEESKYEHGNK